MASNLDLTTAVTAALAAGTAAVAADDNTKVAQKDVPIVIAKAQEAVAPILQDAQAKFDYATSNESLLTSWSANGALFAGVSGAYNIVEAVWDGFQPTDDKTAILTGLASIFGAVLFIVGRIRRKPIGQ